LIEERFYGIYEHTAYYEDTNETKLIGKHLREIGERETCRVVEAEDM